MKIMSFNTQHCLNYLEQKIDFDIMADAIKKCDADIIGLNEMRGECDKAADYADQTAILSPQYRASSRPHRSILRRTVTVLP